MGIVQLLRDFFKVERLVKERALTCDSPKSSLCSCTVQNIIESFPPF